MRLSLVSHSEASQRSLACNRCRIGRFWVLLESGERFEQGKGCENKWRLLGTPRDWENPDPGKAQRCPADVLSRLWPSESGMTTDPLTSGLRCGFGWCWGWRSNRSPQVNPRVIPMVIPQRTSPYANMIFGITPHLTTLDGRCPREGYMRPKRLGVRSRDLSAQRFSRRDSRCRNRRSGLAA